MSQTLTTSLQAARFRAAAAGAQGFGVTPQDALAALMPLLSGDALSPIIIWPYNRADAFWSDAQQASMSDLQGRRDTLSSAERAELETLVAAAFDATVTRTQSLPLTKS
jgi:hypothetical protein